MPDFLPVRTQVDMTGFRRGFELASQFTRKAPADAANYAAKEVAFGAYKNTPFVQPEKINSELSVIETPVIGKRGKPSKRKKMMVQDPSLPIGEASMAVLVIQTRANPKSRYNQLTGGRYALSASPFKGLSRAAGQAAMAAMIDTMVKNRRRATHFIAAGWLSVIEDLKAVVPTRFGGSRPPSQSNRLGQATPARQGIQASCVIENDVGLDNRNPSHNRALMLTMPALQTSLDTVGRKEMDYALSKMGKEDLQDPVNKAWA